MKPDAANERDPGRLPVFGPAVFSTCPQSADFSGTEYVDRVIEVARWSEEAGCAGILVYTDNRLVDPWLVAQIILQNTARLLPLVAVQPVYMHPYSLAKKIASLGMLYRRRVYLNMVAGGFRKDLQSLDDPTPHDERYDRLVEYTRIILDLLARSEKKSLLSVEGRYYTIRNLRLEPPLSPELAPGVFLSGSSDAGMAAGRALGATCVQYPRRVDEYAEPLPDDGIQYGMRVGIVARAMEDEAWRVARERFPEDRKGQLTHQVAMKVSDSQWHRQLSELGKQPEDSPYWLVPFENYKTMCPYLVGSYERVAEELARYVRLRYQTFILDIPPARDELEHIREVFGRAERRIAV